MCTNAPTIGFKIPVIANTIAIKFSPIENDIFNFIVFIILFESDNRCGSSFTSSSTSAISAASIAISLPIPPIAMPTVALLSAGASLTPSPIIQTEPFNFSLLSIKFNLSSGIHSASCSAILSAFAMDVAAFTLSPVSKTGLTPISFKLSIIFLLSLLNVSESTT